MYTISTVKYVYNIYLNTIDGWGSCRHSTHTDKNKIKKALLPKKETLDVDKCVYCKCQQVNQFSGIEKCKSSVKLQQFKRNEQ